LSPRISPFRLSALSQTLGPRSPECLSETAPVTRRVGDRRPDTGRRLLAHNTFLIRDGGVGAEIGSEARDVFDDFVLDVEAIFNLGSFFEGLTCQNC
jgi:hypothetical protein